MQETNKMKKIYQHHDDYDREYRRDEYPQLGYYSKKLMRKRFPDKNYIVIGAIGKGLSSKAKTFIFQNEEYDFYNLKYVKLTYGIDGYLDCGNHEFLAVIQNKTVKRILVLFAAVTVMIGLFSGIYMMMDHSIVLDSDASDYTPKITLPDDADPNSIAIPGYDQLTMLADTDELYAALWNPETNPCYFKFSIFIEDTDKLLYESGLVHPGKAITAVKLNRVLNEGEYPVLIKMETFSLEDGTTPMNGGTSKSVIKAVRE